MTKKLNPNKYHKFYDTVIQVCDIRSGSRCKDCVYYGNECNLVKSFYKVNAPYEVLDMPNY